MRKIILTLAVSLDGYIEGPNKEIDWIEFTEEAGKSLGEFLKEIDTILYGRTSYEAWGHYNPPENSAEFEKEFYRTINSMTKYVFTTSKTDFEGNPIIVHSGVEDSIYKLKKQPGKNIWLYGGAGLISTFMNLDLVDEFRLAVFPVILGSGTALFKNLEHKTNLELLDVKAAESGVVELSYQKLNQ